MARVSRETRAHPTGEESAGHEKEYRLFSTAKNYQLKPKRKSGQRDLRHSFRADALLLPALYPARTSARLVPSDVGFGNETVILACERVGEPYLFKTRRSEGIRALFDSAAA